jgi:hypothetical protein
VDALDALEARLDPTEVAPFLAWKDQGEGIEAFIGRAERCPDCLPHAVLFWRLAVRWQRPDGSAPGTYYNPELWLTAGQAACQRPDKSLFKWPANLLAVPRD